MIDIEKINRLLAWHEKILPEYPFFERDFYDPLMKALGDDEAEIIQFIQDADEDTRQWLGSLIEELHEKFLSAGMEAAIDALIKRVWPDGA
jgi:energy-converting hydrogenase A subunit M